MTAFLVPLKCFVWCTSGLNVCHHPLSDIFLNLFNFVGQLEASISVNKDRKELIPTYISLAQTYVDWVRYDKAIVYFKKEIECYGDENPEQVF